MELGKDNLCFNIFLNIAGNDNFVGFDMVVLDKELSNMRFWRCLTSHDDNLVVPALALPCWTLSFLIDYNNKHISVV